MTHNIPYLPLPAALSKLDEIQQAAKADENLALYHLAKLVAHIAAVAYTAGPPAPTPAAEAIDPAWTPLPITLAAPPTNPPGTPVAATQTLQAAATAAVQGQHIRPLNSEHHLTVVLHVTLEKPVPTTDLSARQTIKDKIAGRAHNMQGIAFVEVL